MGTTPTNSESSSSQVTSQINGVAREVQALQTTQIFKDDTGTRRVILGKGADGFYGLKVSQAGNDVYTAANDELIFNSDQNVFKIVSSGTISVATASLNTGGANYGTGSPTTTTVAHGLGYTPAIMSFWSSASSYSPMPKTDVFESSSTSFCNYMLNVSVDDTNIVASIKLFGYNVNTSFGPITFKYYLLQETAN